MSTVINSNLSSLAAQNALRINSVAQQTAMERLSTGMRINNAKDDAAGLAITSRMTSDIRGMAVAVRNANDGISMTQTAEGSLSAIQDSLQRIRELTVQAGNDTNGSADRTSMQNEVDALVKEIDRVVGVTSFNGQSLLDGTFKTGKEAVIQVGTGDTSNDQIKIAIADYKTTTLKVDALKLDTAANAQKALTAITTAINTVSDGRAALGTNQNQLSAAITNLSNTSVSLQASRSRIMDTDYATETTNLAKTQIIQQAATAMLAQANQSSQSVLALLK